MARRVELLQQFAQLAERHALGLRIGRRRRDAHQAAQPQAGQGRDRTGQGGRPARA